MPSKEVSPSPLSHQRPTTLHATVKAYIELTRLHKWPLGNNVVFWPCDRTDDVKAGVKSTALLFGAHVKPVLRAFAFAFVALMSLAGFLNGNGPWFYVVSCGGTALHILWQQYNWDDTNMADCMAKFKSNGDMGAIIWFGLFMDYLSRIGALPIAISR
ncbi:hypothetical protein EIP86_009641 [Pleurotus ostreatoroseus]|nr:hypothetical protein EIP86_009641 [Pleurotus ostreatoroseus]